MMSVYPQKGRDTFTYDFQLRGKRYAGNTGEKTKAKAEAAERRIKDGVKLELAKLQGIVPMTFGDAVANYVDSHGRTGKAVQTEDRNFIRLIEWIGEDTPVHKITSAIIADVVARRSAMHVRDLPARGKLSPAEVNRSTVDLLKRVLYRARDVLGQNVSGIDWKKLRKKEAGIRTREVTLAEDDKIEPFLTGGHGACWKFGLLSGLRLENLVTLKWSQIDFADRTLTVVQKGERPHVIRLDREMMAILKEQVGLDPEAVWTYVASRTRKEPRSKRLLVRGQRYPLTVSGFVSWSRTMKKHAKVSDLRIHDLRRTAGSRMLRGTDNLRAAQRLLGHSSIATTAKHYAHLTGDDMLKLQDKANGETAKRRKSQQNANKAKSDASNALL